MNDYVDKKKVENPCSIIILTNDTLILKAHCEMQFQHAFLQDVQIKYIVMIKAETIKKATPCSTVSTCWATLLF